MLFYLLQLPVDPILTEDEMYYIVQQVACGLAHLHLNKVVHSDIKPANIMVIFHLYNSCNNSVRLEM